MAPTMFLIDQLVTRHHVNGGLAQLGERLAGSQKVTGSSPVSSTPTILTVARTRICDFLA